MSGDVHPPVTAAKLTSDRLHLHTLTNDASHAKAVPTTLKWIREQRKIVSYDPLVVLPLDNSQDASDDRHWGTTSSLYSKKSKQTDSALVILQPQHANNNNNNNNTKTPSKPRLSVVKALQPRTSNGPRKLSSADHDVPPLRNKDPQPRKENRAPTPTDDKQQQDDDDGRKEILEQRKQRRRQKAVIVRDRSKTAGARGKQAAAGLAVSRKRQREPSAHSKSSSTHTSPPAAKGALYKSREYVQELRQPANVGPTRITLNPITVGLFNKSRRSKRLKTVKGPVPDLVFSDLRFLEKKDQKAQSKTSSPDSSSQQRSISAFFGARKAKAASPPLKPPAAAPSTSAHSAHSIEMRKGRASRPSPAKEPLVVQETVSVSPAAVTTKPPPAPNPPEPSVEPAPVSHQQASVPKNLLERGSSSIDRLLKACERGDWAAIQEQANCSTVSCPPSVEDVRKESFSSIDFDKYDRILAELLHS